jgi:hypothetical protein
LLFGTIFSMGRSARRTLPEFKPIPLALQTVFITFAVGCISISALPTFDIFFILMMMAACWQVVARDAAIQPTGQAPGNVTVIPLPQAAVPAYSR